jgi:hypothetical protein
MASIKSKPHTHGKPLSGKHINWFEEASCIGKYVLACFNAQAKVEFERCIFPYAGE